MSIALLPDELVEIIFSFVRKKTAPPDQESHQTFASLALTSRRFVMLARSYLYFRPILQPFRHVTWEKAIALCSALSSRLGRLVNSLEGIVDFVSEVGTLVEPRTPLSFQLAREGREGYTEAFSLYYALLKACPTVVFTELIFNSIGHLAKVVEALESSSAPLKTVRFTNSAFSSYYFLTEALVLRALRRKRFRTIENVEIGPIRKSSRFNEPKVGLPLKSLSFFGGVYFRTLLPKDPSALSSIAIEQGDLTSAEIVWLIDHLPPTITSFHLSRMGHPSAVLALYQSAWRSALPIDAFSRLTSLSHLALQGYTISLELLKCLASSSPSVSSLDFMESIWIPSPSSRDVPRRSSDSLSGIVEPDDLLDQLLEFKQLTRVHLGTLPTTTRQTYSVIEEELGEKRGIEVDWTVCRS
ncbi:hypothetical protein JCM3766R1_000912 [Sporobolomyces carnicolor]